MMDYPKASNTKGQLTDIDSNYRIKLKPKFFDKTSDPIKHILTHWIIMTRVK